MAKSLAITIRSPDIDHAFTSSNTGKSTFSVPKRKQAGIKLKRS